MGAIWTPRGGGKKGPRAGNVGRRTQSVRKIRKIDVRRGNKVLKKVKALKKVKSAGVKIKKVVR